MSRQGYGKATPKVGTPTTNRPSSHRDAGSHPGELDRMVGGKKVSETGVSSPKHVGG